MIHKDDGRPRFVSSDRHLAAGLIDVEEATWNAAEKRLSGRSSHLVSNARFEYVFHVPQPLEIVHARFGTDDGRFEPLGDGFYAVQFTASAPQLDWEVALSQP